MKLRVLNGLFWVWLCLSSVLLPVVSDESEFWAAKVAQMFQINPHLLSDPARFSGNLLIPVILWFLIDRALQKRAIKTVKKEVNP